MGRSRLTGKSVFARIGMIFLDMLLLFHDVYGGIESGEGSRQIKFVTFQTIIHRSTRYYLLPLCARIT